MGWQVCDGSACFGGDVKELSKIPVSRPSITELEMTYVQDAICNGWGEKCYDYIHQFEDTFSQHIGVKHAIATSSCTGALQMGMAALGIGSGDEVILADTNWIATVAPITHLGAKPVFVDILVDTWCVDPARVEAAITSKTKAIVAVHLYGNLCDMDQLLDIGKRYGIPVIEDAAEAIGSRIGTQRAGSMGVFSSFSFHGSKTITTGEGGMFVTNDSDLYERVLTLSNHGRARHQTKQFWPEVVGYKFKISNVQAAIGLAQTQRAETLIIRKREILARYQENLKDFQQIKMNMELPGTTIGAWMPTAVFDESTGVLACNLVRKFADHLIDARVFFHPLSTLPMFDSHCINANATSIASRAINLPSYHDITELEIERVCQVIRDVLHG